MNRNNKNRIPGVLFAGVLLWGGGPAITQTLDPSLIDCLGPAGEAEPGTVEWQIRESENAYCAQQRILDKAEHPAGALAVEDPEADVAVMASRDVYRMPDRHDGTRFRYLAETAINRDGLEVPVEVYRPCTDGTCTDMPAALQTHEPPYPVVIVVPGGAQGFQPGAPKELYRWIAQALAEAGYLTALHDITSAHLEDAQDVLNWVLTTFAGEVDAEHIGIVGHSGGGATAALLGQIDERFSAIVAYDRSSRYDLPEMDSDITEPTLFFVGDYGIGVQPYTEDPNPDGTAELEGFERLRGLGVDTMHLALRAASHLDWSPPNSLAGNRYAEVTSLYYTLAWFDRYLKGADDVDMAKDAFQRLTASTFDDSGDAHNISQGLYDPVKAAESGDPYGGNVPYSIAGTSIVDRLSFYFLSRCAITLPPGSAPLASSDDMRSQRCAAQAPGLDGVLGE